MRLGLLIPRLGLLIPKKCVHAIRLIGSLKLMINKIELVCFLLFSARMQTNIRGDKPYVLLVCRCGVRAGLIPVLSN